MSRVLPDGRRLEQRGDAWLLYPSTGFVEYVGDYDGLVAYIVEKGIEL